MRVQGGAMPFRSRTCKGLAVSLLALAVALPVRAQLPPASCQTSLPSPLLVQIAGELGDVLIDDQCEYAYATNRAYNRVEVLSLRTGTLGAPIPVGSTPMGLDASPDGGTLYVANTGGNNFSVVDLVQGIETHKVPVPAGFMNDRPFSIAVASNGLVFFSTTFGGSGFGGRMMQWDPVSGVVSQRADFWHWGTNTEATFLEASADRSVIGIVAGDISSGPVFKYKAATNAFTQEKDLQTFISTIALDRTGTVALVGPGTFVLDADLLLSGTIAGGGLGVAVDPSGRVGYRVLGGRIDVLDLVHFLITDSLSLGDTVQKGNSYGFGPGIGRMTISRDGSLLAVITDHGLSLVRPGAPRWVPLASLSGRSHVTLGAAAKTDMVDLIAFFALGADSNGMDPANEDVTIRLGGYSITIPAGSFQPIGSESQFNGSVGGAAVTASLRPRDVGGYRLACTIGSIDFKRTVIPMPMTLTIGDDQGTTTLPDGQLYMRAR